MNVDGGVRGGGQAWPDERVEALKRLAAEGYTGGEIAAELGLTRNQVVGKLWRMGISIARRAGDMSPNWKGGREASRERDREKRRVGGQYYERIKLENERRRQGGPNFVSRAKPADEKAQRQMTFSQILRKRGPICAGLRG